MGLKILEQMVMIWFTKFELDSMPLIMLHGGRIPWDFKLHCTKGLAVA